MRTKIFAFISFMILSICASSTFAWTGDVWGPMTVGDIDTLACQMIDTPWSPLNTINNNGTNYYAGTVYWGETYSGMKPAQSWAEFLNSVSTTTSGNTTYGNNCEGLVSISWKLPSFYYISYIDKGLGGTYFYALGEVGDAQSVALQRGDALYSKGTSTVGAHIILFDQYNPDGTVLSMEQVPPIARRRSWSWSALSGFRPVRRDLLTDGPAVNDRVETSAVAAVRSCPSLSCDPPIWTAPPASQGTIIDGPVKADKFKWWMIQYDDYPTPGWSNEGFVAKISDLALTCNPGDAAPPTGDLTINDIASYTIYTTVTLNLSCNDVDSGCSAMRFSNDNSQWSAWEPYAASKQWTIATGTVPSSVYVQYQDACGNISSIYNSTILLQTLLPDFMISYLAAPASVKPGQTVTITDTTANIGAGGANASTTSYYLSATSSLTSAATTLGSRSVPALAPGASSAGSVSVTLPTGIAGTYYLIAKANGIAPINDCGYMNPCGGPVLESNNSNNMKSATIKIGPDLIVSALSGPAVAGSGATISITETTMNNGTGDAGASSTGYYFSTNTTLDAADVLVGSRLVPALAAGLSSSGTATITLPSGLATGVYYIIAKTDYTNSIPETSETNNTKYMTITVGPDLIVSALTGPATAGSGAMISITDTTKNNGSGDAGASTTAFYFSTNTTFDSGDTLLGGRSVPALGAGLSSSGTATITLPSGLATGVYYIIARADYTNSIPETSETNNTKYMTIAVGPDLIVSALTGPAVAGSGATISITDTTKNNGSGEAGASGTGYYFSTNTTFDSGDVLIGSRSVLALGAGLSSSGTATITLPSGLAARIYYIIARADDGNVVAETNETNNTKYAAIGVGPDLLAYGLIAPASASAGTTISITDTTKNSGGDTAGASTTNFYLSTNTVWDSADLLLGGRPVSALGGGVSSIGTTAVTIPVLVAPGTYYIIMKVDDGNAVSEFNENNNTKYRAITVN